MDIFLKEHLGHVITAVFSFLTAVITAYLTYRVRMEHERVHVARKETKDQLAAIDHSVNSERAAMIRHLEELTNTVSELRGRLEVALAAVDRMKQEGGFNG